MTFLTVLGGYIITSLIFLRFPTVLHKKKNHKFRCRHISHRGGAAENLENTMTAFKHAADLGTDMLELDCQITKDGQVVVSHDPNLNRVTSKDVEINETNYSDLPSIMSTLKVDFFPNLVIHGDDRRIPLLREVFEACPQLPINIDIKVDNDDLIAKVDELIRQYKREEITVWGNKSSVIVDKCYQQNPKIPTLLSIRRVVIMYILFYSGLLPFVPIREGFFEMIMPSIIKKFSLPLKYRIILSIIDRLSMSKVLITHLHRRGIQTYLWVLNDEEEYKRAFDLGATGVMTDCPTKLKEYLAKNPIDNTADPLLQ